MKRNRVKGKPGLCHPNANLVDLEIGKDSVDQKTTEVRGVVLDLSKEKVFSSAALWL